MSANGGVFMPAILNRIAPELGAVVTLEPGYEIVGHIRFPNGRQSYFWHNKFNLNSVASVRICQDKGYAAFFLEKWGFSVPNGRVFVRRNAPGSPQRGPGLEDALEFAAELGWPVFLKPLCGSQGVGVIKASNAAECETAARALFERERKILVQEACPGRDYRLVVLDGEVISAYERIPLNVIGDGVRTVSALLTAQQMEFEAIGRDTVIQMDDPRIAEKLHSLGLDFGTVPPKGATVPLLDVANLSCGGTTSLVSDLHPSVAALAAKIAVALDLRFAGVDIVMANAAAPLGSYTVLEVNTAPGLDHYASHGAEHEASIDRLYLKLLTAVAREPQT